MFSFCCRVNPGYSDAESAAEGLLQLLQAGHHASRQKDHDAAGAVATSQQPQHAVNALVQGLTAHTPDELHNLLKAVVAGSSIAFGPDVRGAAGGGATDAGAGNCTIAKLPSQEADHGTESSVLTSSALLPQHIQHEHDQKHLTQATTTTDSAAAAAAAAAALDQLAYYQHQHQHHQQQELGHGQHEEQYIHPLLQHFNTGGSAAAAAAGYRAQGQRDLSPDTSGVLITVFEGQLQAAIAAHRTAWTQS
jgi:hypothetical protein